METTTKSTPKSTSTTPVVVQSTSTSTSTTTLDDDDNITDESKAATYYNSITSRLPPSITSHLPTSSQINSISNRVSDLHRSNTAKLHHYRQDKIIPSLKGIGATLDPEQLCKNAWSVTNGTQVPLNVSLNQVGPLMYQVLLPNETFERRVPRVWYYLEIRPWTSPDTAYNQWSVSWPILAVTGPVVAATSLLAIPFVALAVGGTALASLTGFGTTLASGASSTAAALTSTAASTVSLASKAQHLPYGPTIKSRLVDAAQSIVGPGQDAVKQRVVRYLSNTAAVAAFGGVAGGVKGEEDAEREWRERKEKLRREKKVQEVDVTGYELEKVLKCETGKRKVDKALEDAFKKLALKSRDFKTKSNPVLKIIGGPELEVRDQKTWLVFYPFHVQQVVNIVVEPLSTEEVPVTEEEEGLMRDARVVETAEEAERVVEGLERDDKMGEEVLNKDKDKEKEKEKKGWFGGWGK